MASDPQLKVRLQLSRSLSSARLHFQVYSLVDMLGGQLLKALALFSPEDYDAYFQERLDALRLVSEAAAERDAPPLPDRRHRIRSA